jgi:putative transposase
MTTMQLVEQHIIDKVNPYWSAIDTACFLSKNLYNAANYILRQEYIFHGRYIPYADLDKRMKANPDYCVLPRKVSQQVLRQVDHDWRSFFAALREWKQEPDKFKGRPGLPRYKHKTDGRNELVYTVQAVSRPALEKGVDETSFRIVPSQLGIQIKTKQKNINQVRIVPRKSHYVVEVVYTVQQKPAELDENLIAGMDIGLDNLAAVTSNKPGFKPFLVNGRPLKSINQFYNKHRAVLQSQLDTTADPALEARLERLTDRRNRKIKHEMHVASRRMIDRLAAEGIGVLVIGKNDGWKQDIHLGKRTNQNFVAIPHAQFINMLTYKAELLGMRVVLTEESYTSKCSFLDLEPLESQQRYAGRRVHRGLFRANSGRTLNADINGSYNMIRKVAPSTWTSEGVERAVVHASTFHYIA